jgi:membrane protein DedA with SNARE-associated domain
MVLPRTSIVDLVLGISVVVAGLLTAVLVGLGLAVYVGRRSRSYLLVVLSLLALFARSVVAAGALLGVVPEEMHHVLEHGLDIAMAALVVAAVYYVRAVDDSVRGGAE